MYVSDRIILQRRGMCGGSVISRSIKGKRNAEKKKSRGCDRSSTARTVEVLIARKELPERFGSVPNPYLITIITMSHISIPKLLHSAFDNKSLFLLRRYDSVTLASEKDQMEKYLSPLKILFFFHYVRFFFIKRTNKCNRQIKDKG